MKRKAENREQENQTRKDRAQTDQEADIRSHAFWSGTITFGLVSIPVALFPGNRGRQVSLRMLAPDGTALKRRYFCPRDGRELSREEIVRGYEIADEQFVIVTDAELESLEPRKSREIDLIQFVPADQLDPVFFDRAYILAPLGDALKPYRLLAATMEQTGRAGLATFIMRGKEYLVAILSEKGILSAETLRFADEIRSPDEVGLPEAAKAPQAQTSDMRAEIRKLKTRDLDHGELRDPYVRQLKELVAKKLKTDYKVLLTTDGTDAESNLDEQENNVIDLMEVLKRSMGGTA